MSEYIPRRFEVVIAEMLAVAASISDRATDFNIGSVMRSLLESVAVEIERAEVGFGVAVQRGILESAYTLWGFPRQPATRAYGSLRLYVSPAPVSPIFIPRGSRFGIPGTTLYYTTEENFTYPAGVTQYDITAIAMTEGRAGNVAANTITQIISSLPDIDSCTNPEAFFTGDDEETDGQRRTRFSEYIRSIHRGTTEALELGAKQAALVDVSGYVTEQVVSAQAIARAGVVSVYIWNGVDGASTSLINTCETILNGQTLASRERVPGYKAAGITVNVYEVSQVATPVTVTVTLEEGFSLSALRPACVTQVERVFQQIDIGDTLYPSQLACAVRRVPGVLDAEVGSPSAEVDAGDGEIVTLSGTPVIQEPPETGE